MDTALIYRAMYEDKHIRRQLGGVLAADMFCDQIKRPGFYTQQKKKGIQGLKGS